MTGRNSRVLKEYATKSLGFPERVVGRDGDFTRCEERNKAS